VEDKAILVALKEFSIAKLKEMGLLKLTHFRVACFYYFYFFRQISSCKGQPVNQPKRLDP